VELRAFLGVYALSLPLQLLTTGAVLEQGSTPLVVLTAVHAGVVAALFWTLVANAVVATQVVEDGTWSSLVVSSYPFAGVGILNHRTAILRTFTRHIRDNNLSIT
jgi:hypothetical protein